MKINVSLLVSFSLLSFILPLSVLPNKALAGETIVTCTTDKYRVEIQKNNNRYKYIAWTGDSSTPSLVLNGGKYYNNGKTNDSGYKSYTFRNGAYKYIIGINPMSGMHLAVEQSGKSIYDGACN